MKNRGKMMCALAATFAAALFAACSPSVNTYENADAGAGKTVIKDKRVITDWGTEDFANVVEIRTGTTADGKNLRVQIELVNEDSDFGRIAYQVEWFDAAGLKIETPTSWIPLTIAPEQRATISLVAPNPAAKDFRISMMRTAE